MLIPALSAVNEALRRRGLEIAKYGPTNPRYHYRQALLDQDVTTVIDGGANVGQYAKSVRKLRPDISIVSFEPIPSVFAQLQAAFSGDSRWTGHCVGLGREDRELEINITENSQSSSFLNQTRLLNSQAAGTQNVDRVQATLRRLDTIIGQPAGGYFLKLDCQGFEGEILAGARATLAATKYVLLEISFEPLYEAAPEAHELIASMHDLGFRIWTVLPGFSHRSENRMLQADILFGRSRPPQAGGRVVTTHG